MFDEVNNNKISEPEDILAQAEGPVEPVQIKSALANQKLRPVAKSAEKSELEEENLEPEIEITPPLLSRKSVFIIVGVVLILVVGIGAAIVVWRSAKKTPGAVTIPLPANKPTVPPSAVSPLPTSPQTPSVAEVTIPLEQPVSAPATVTPPQPVDTDGDGLSDEEETKYGTDIQKNDTDNDELTDYEEIMIWKTNPLNPDTDGDGFNDGLEVKNNYNPLGDGKLLELPKK